MTDEQWYAMIDVHLTAPFRILRASADFLRNAAKEESEAGQEKFRKVVNVSSIAGVGGNAGQVNYAAAKAGVIGMTATLDIEDKQIKAGVNPELLKQMEALVPLGRGGTPEEAAGAIALLCYPESNYISGELLVCGGGFRV